MSYPDVRMEDAEDDTLECTEVLVSMTYKVMVPIVDDDYYSDVIECLEMDLGRKIVDAMEDIEVLKVSR